MKPTPEMIEAALHARVPGGAEVWAWLPQKDAWTPHETARDVMQAALSAALSVPAAAVVGEPVAWTSVGQLKAVAEGMNATITKNGDEFMNIPLYAFNLSESPQEAFARWLNDGPKLAKSAGVYVGISVKPAPPALGGQP